MDPLAARRDAIKEQYGFSAWPSAEPAAEAPAAARVVLEPDALPGVVHSERLPLPQPAAYVDTLADASGRHGRIGVWIRHFASALDASEALVDELAWVMAPELPACADRGLDVGDVCFCGLDDPIGTVMFARGHVLVTVRALDDSDTPVAEVAAAVDGQVRRALGPP